jgi:hypothetical protein
MAAWSSLPCFSAFIADLLQSNGCDGRENKIVIWFPIPPCILAGRRWLQFNDFELQNNCPFKNFHSFEVPERLLLWHACHEALLIRTLPNLTASVP